ncbi:MAG: sialate O-acetylesterase [Opitutaceae bacterium]|nr:sialate O-acetylesterase [Opitutaceae bacterium]
MKLPLRPALVSLTLAFASGAGARADVTPAALFTENAVLQRDKPVPVWGTAAKGEKVTVTFGSQQRTATAGDDGRWIAILDPLPASTTGADLVIAAGNTITLRNVLVGEVWLCSGQSNMEWPLARTANAAADLAAANSPLLRHLRVEQNVAETPADAVKTSGWQVSSPETAGGFTAVGYFFARDLHQKLGVPIGIIHSSWGGTPIESWLSPAALASDPAFAVIGERWQADLAAYPSRKTEYEAALAAWTRSEAEARLAAPGRAAAAKPGRGGVRPDAAAVHQEWLRQNPRPRPPRGPGDPRMPAGLFNGMINPLLPGALRGILWYPGEGNAARATEYHALFTALITAWRAHFAQGDVSFYWVNFAGYAPAADLPGQGRTFAFLREAQTKALTLPNTGQAITLDLGENRNVPPAHLPEVGRRLALLARTRDYDLVGDDTGPTFVSASREGAALRVRFAHATGGLVAHDKPVQALELAGADRVFHPAEGRIERGTLLVSSPAVREPVAVRYAFTNFPEANLFNGAGLPAVPFRSDEW